MKKWFCVNRLKTYSMFKSVFIIATLISGFSLTAQSQTVILINGAPTEVILDGTEIDTVLGTDNQAYMKGFDSEVPNKMRKSTLKKMPTQRASIGHKVIKKYYITGIDFNRTDDSEMNTPSELRSRIEE